MGARLPSVPRVLCVAPAHSARMRWAAARIPPAAHLAWLLLSRTSSSLLPTSRSLAHGPVPCQSYTMMHLLLALSARSARKPSLGMLYTLCRLNSVSVIGNLLLINPSARYKAVHAPVRSAALPGIFRGLAKRASLSWVAAMHAVAVAKAAQRAERAAGSSA